MRLRRLLVPTSLLLALVTFSSLAPAPAAPAPVPLADHRPGELLVGFTPDARGLDRAGARASLNALRIGGFRTGAEHWRLGPGIAVPEAIERLKRNPRVRYAEPNYVVSTSLTPNDPRFPELYGMRNDGQTGGTPDADIDAEMAWNVSRGSRGVIVGVIDTGVDYGHVDLAANMWTNPGEIAGDRVDNDGNGYVDDLHGYDFVNNDGDPFDDHGHGTHCAGTIGGVGNNGVGVVGVNWEVSLMALKFLGAGGSGSIAHAVLAVEYATMMGVDLTSNSWGGGGYSQTMVDALEEAGAHEIAFIAAAGNGGTDTDQFPHYPSSYNLPNVISVAATDHDDLIAGFSNWGLTSVDLGAPGVSILSASPGGGYRLLSGTSMATPHVAGAAALMRALAPGIPVAQIKAGLMASGDAIPALSTTGPTPVASGRRLNAFMAIADPDFDPPGAASALSVTDPASNSLVLQWTAPGDDGQTGQASYYEIYFALAPIDEQNLPLASLAAGAPAPTPAGTAQSLEVAGLDPSTTYFFVLRAFDEWGNAGPLSVSVSGTTLPPPVFGYAPDSFSAALFTGERTNRTLTLRNDGPGTLDFAGLAPFTGGPTAAIPAWEPLPKGVEPDPGPPLTESLGGPDSFGYRWVDSDEAAGPRFVWADISTTGTVIPGLTGDDQTSGPVALGFSFPFYGSRFESIRVSTNGWISFTSGSNTWSNTPLPSAQAPENLVAALWDDLHPRGENLITFHSDGARAIVQWTGITFYSDPSASLTFQMILEASGRITFQYLSLDGGLSSATVGIQDATRSTGLTTAFNQPYLRDGLAIRYTSIPRWLSVSPGSGRIPAGGSMALDVLIDASGLDGGTYGGSLPIQTNDPLRSLVEIPVTLLVTGAPEISVIPAVLDFGTVYASFPAALDLLVENVGSEVLRVSGIDASDPALEVSPVTFDVAPHSGRVVRAQWTPAGPGPFSGLLTIRSDAANDPAMPVPVTGVAVPPPVLVADPESIVETLDSGGAIDRTLTLSNAGGSDLTVSATVDPGQCVPSQQGAGTQGSGGPDAFGYRFRDSDDPCGPAFPFVDISGTGTAVGFSAPDDALSASINMGLTFPFYGNAFTSVKVSTNGWITFDTSTTLTVPSNGNLPSTSLPRSAIALYWDDLHLRSGSVRYLNDGLRFIVQYTNVGRRDTLNQSLTFQVQLYPDGRILILYKTMLGAILNSATVGIQNQARTVGLAAAAQFGSGTPYVHNDLAVEFTARPDWIAIAPLGSFTIPPGQSRSYTVRLDANGRPGGTLTGDVLLATNSPALPLVRLPVTLHVIGSPAIGIFPLGFDFGSAFVGYSALQSFQVLNRGSEVLNVSRILTTDPSLTVEDLPGPSAVFSVPPQGTRLLSLRWSPTTAGSLAAQILIESDDPATPQLAAAVSGQALFPPQAHLTPMSLDITMTATDTIGRNLSLTNEGGSFLSFTNAFRASTGPSAVVHPETELKDGESDPRPGLLGNGGPDRYGYRWFDSDAPAGPVFSWVDIATTGQPVPGLDGDDEVSDAIPIGFEFPFHGSRHATLRVSTDGWISFLPVSPDSFNDPLPSLGAPASLIAAFWDNLDFGGALKARYLNDGSRFILQWTDVRQASGASSLTFQVLLYPNGRIVLQYLSMQGQMDSATIGTQNLLRDDGLTVVFNRQYVRDLMAVEILPPVDYLLAFPVQGFLAPGSTADISVRVLGARLLGGEYAATLDVTTNDPASPVLSVPILLHVTGFPDLSVTPNAVRFPATFTGFASTLPLELRNTGSDVLTITSASLPPPFSLPGLALPLSIAPGGAHTVEVAYRPATAGTDLATLTLESNDHDTPVVSVPLEGAGLFPPEFEAEPAAIATALPPSSQRTRTVLLRNTGGSDLTWQAGTALVSVQSYSDPVDLPKGEENPRVGILGSGGPDLFGYRWKDSDEPGGPVFDWVDIRDIGTPIPISGDDQNFGPIAIGFPFSFYGATFTGVRVTTNGWLSFSSTSSVYTNSPLPNPLAPPNMLAVFWDDLHFRGSLRARYWGDANRFIVQYTNVDTYATGSDLTFQVILHASGRIVYQYLTMSGILGSATIGLQNAAGTDGLTVVYNAGYVHDGLAIAIGPLPEWAILSPIGGTIPAGGTAQVDVALDSTGLEDGPHQGSIQMTSNDPYLPERAIPLSLNVGLMEPAYLNFDPDALNLSGHGNSVKMVIELPPGYDPHAVPVETIRLQDAVPALPSPVSWSDENGNGVEELVVRFDKGAVQAILPEGSAVPVTIQLEEADVQWFRGTTIARTLNPRVTAPAAGAFLAAGDRATIAWDAPQPGGAMTYAIHLSRDGGVTFEPIAAGTAGQSFEWMVTAPGTSAARIRVLAFDSSGLAGYGTSAADFVIGDGAALPPHGVGADLEALVAGGELILKWPRPPFDAGHAPAQFYRIYRASSPAGPFEPIAEVAVEEFREPIAGGTPPGFYRVVAVNAGGESAD